MTHLKIFNSSTIIFATIHENCRDYVANALHIRLLRRFWRWCRWSVVPYPRIMPTAQSHTQEQSLL